MIIASSERVPLEKCPALVLNADFRPLSYYPLSLWCWQDAIKSVFLNRFFITLKVPASLGLTEWHLISCEVKLMEFILIC